jgi:hypothetical protein
LARSKAHYRTNKKRYKRWAARWRSMNPNYAYLRGESLRKEFLKEYGSCCSCCGESNPLFLTLDHIHGNGKAHRHGRNRRDLLYELKKRGWPKDEFRLLCFNCNMGRERTQDKQCPHSIMNQVKFFRLQTGAAKRKVGR